MLIFSDGPSAKLHSFGLAGFKLRDNGTGHFLIKSLSPDLQKVHGFSSQGIHSHFFQSWVLDIMNLSKSVLLFPFRARYFFFSTLKCNITFWRNYFHHSSQSVSYQEPFPYFPAPMANGRILLPRDKLNWGKHKTRLLSSKRYLISAAEVTPTKRPYFK